MEPKPTQCRSTLLCSLNGYWDATTHHVPPGWERWFAIANIDYYNCEPHRALQTLVLCPFKAFETC